MHSRDPRISQSPGRKARRRYQVLLVDGDDQLRRMIAKHSPAGRRLDVHHVRTIAEARKRLERGGVDVAVIEATLPDGSGVSLAEELSTGQRMIQTMLTAQSLDVNAAVAAMRAGAMDFLTKTADEREITGRLERALDRQDKERSRARRVRRLRTLCKQLNQARLEVSEQVDVLCADLVSAYHDLAAQMQQAMQCGEYAGLIRDELDLEQLLSRTLEFLIEKAGPCNAMVFLPSGMDEYSVGAYVNYDDLSGAQLLRDHLAQQVVPRVAEQDHPVFASNDAMLREWLGAEATWLEGRQVLAGACKHDGETLAALVLFRRESEPLPEVMTEIVTGMAPLLAEALCKVIRVHHRAVLMDEDEGEQVPW